MPRGNLLALDKIAQLGCEFPQSINHRVSVPVLGNLRRDSFQVCCQCLRAVPPPFGVVKSDLSGGGDGRIKEFGALYTFFGNGHLAVAAEANFKAGDFTQRVLRYFGGKDQRIRKIDWYLNRAFAGLHDGTDGKQVAFGDVLSAVKLYKATHAARGGPMG